MTKLLYTLCSLLLMVSCYSVNVHKDGKEYKTVKFGISSDTITIPSELPNFTKEYFIDSKTEVLAKNDYEAFVMMVYPRDKSNIYFLFMLFNRYDESHEIIGICKWYDGDRLYWCYEHGMPSSCTKDRFYNKIDNIREYIEE